MESWEDIFEVSDTNIIFNNILNIYLKMLYSCFTKSIHSSAHKYNPWITRGIKICAITKDFHILVVREVMILNSNYDKKYCKILTDVIKTAKKKVLC